MKRQLAQISSLFTCNLTPKSLSLASTLSVKDVQTFKKSFLVDLPTAEVHKHPAFKSSKSAVSAGWCEYLCELADEVTGADRSCASLL